MLNRQCLSLRCRNDHQKDEVNSIHLHPVLAAWFAGHFPAWTPIQREALPHTLAGENALILAPTGSGKTLAAFLSVLDFLAHEAENLPNAARAIYVSPLRSLTADIHRNLTPPLGVLNASLPANSRIRMEVRTGDTELPDRGRQQRRRPHLLLTTPESLSSLLSQSGWNDGFDPRTVIVDEIHAFAESKRGSLLSLTLERLEARAARRLQRIGLSATAYPVSAVKDLLCGRRRCAVAAVDATRAHRLGVAAPLESTPLPAAGYNPYRIAHRVALLVNEARTTLVFTATRSAAERMGLALGILLPQWEDRIAVHHASIERERRLAIEEALAAGTLKAVVCSTSLELGIDFAAVDQVILIGAPRGVSRAVQRLGRSGHRFGGVAQGVLAPLSLYDMIECVALRQALRDGRLDELRPPRAPLDVLAQALLGMAIEKPWTPDAAFRLVLRAGPFRSLTREDFDAVVVYLAGGGKVLGPYGDYGKIVLGRDGRYEAASRTVARQYYMNLGTISDDYQVKVVGRNNRIIGRVEENFLADLKPGEAFVIGGKAVKLKRWRHDTAIVEPAAGEHVQTPRWMGGKMSLTAQLSREELRLRKSLRRAWARGRVAACRRVLQNEWHVSPEVAGLVADFVAAQNRAAPVPVDSPVQVERIERRSSITLIFHVVAGRAINRSLAWVAAERLGLGASVAGNHDDHSFLLSVAKRDAPDEDRLRAAFAPQGWQDELRQVLATTSTLGKRFRAVAETGQLLPRRTVRGRVPPKSATWSGSLLYTTFLAYEPEHPLVREAVREVLEDELDAERAAREASRIHAAPWEIYELPRPSPFALPLFSLFNREVLVAGDPDRALEELATELYQEWESPT